MDSGEDVGKEGETEEEGAGRWKRKKVGITISSDASPIFLPRSLFCHSDVLESEELPVREEVMPGTTRGILWVGDGFVRGMWGMLEGVD